MPNNLEPGNPNYELAYRCLGVIDYLEAFTQAHGVNAAGRGVEEAAFAIMTEHEATLAELLLAYLRGRSDVTIIGDPGSPAIVRSIDPSGIGIRFGRFL